MNDNVPTTCYATECAQWWAHKNEVRMKSFSTILGVVAATALMTTTAFAEGGPLAIWGGGKQGGSVYTDVYVPSIIGALEQQALAGYTWGGVSEGTVANAATVTKNPTNLAVGQYDLLKDLNGKPSKDGTPYAFTILAPDIGPECLYLVTAQPGYNTFGDFLGNAFQISVATGSELSGSYGTFKKLNELYPDIGQMVVENVGGAPDIIEAVKSGKTTHGFFVMRPDPQSETFKAINEAKLTIIPVVDFGLQDDYKFLNLKVANGGFLGIGGQAKSVNTACTSVSLITGDPTSAAATSLTPRDLKRLQVTIQRVGSMQATQLRPNISSWADMWDNLTVLAQDQAQAAMEASKKALDDILAAQGK